MHSCDSSSNPIQQVTALCDRSGVQGYEGLSDGIRHGNGCGCCVAESESVEVDARLRRLRAAWRLSEQGMVDLPEDVLAMLRLTGPEWSDYRDALIAYELQNLA